MEYIIAGICFTLCTIVIIWGLKVLKENRKLESKNNDEDDEILYRP